MRISAIIARVKTMTSDEIRSTIKACEQALAETKAAASHMTATQRLLYVKQRTKVLDEAIRCLRQELSVR